MFNYNSVRKMLDQRPFIPFEVVLSSGETFRVSHPEVAILNRLGLVIAYPEDDTVNICAFLHMTAIRTLPLAQAS